MTVAEPGVRADVNYIRNPPRGDDVVLEFVTEDETQSTMVTRPGEPMWITDARGLTTDVDREGFVLVPHVSPVADFGKIEEDPDVDQQYIDEMTGLLTEVTGAPRWCSCWWGQEALRRDARSQELASLKNAKPARYPHADNTDASSVELADLIEHVRRSTSISRAYSRARDVQHVASGLAAAAGHPAGGVRRPLGAPDDEVTTGTVLRGASATMHVRHDTTGYRTTRPPVALLTPT